MMEYKIPGIGDGIFSGMIAKRQGGPEYVIKIDDAEKSLRVLSTDGAGMEFLLDNRYHRIRYVRGSTSEMEMVVDGVAMTVNMHPRLDKIVYKNSGGAGAGGTQTALKSQIPGKVVSIDAEEGAAVKKGDVVCTLESMKMQVGVKAHRDGTIKSVKIRSGGSVAKNDVIAEIE